MIPNGRYRAIVVEAIMGETKNGKEQLEIVWSIVDNEEYNDATCSSLHYFTGGAKEFTLATMEHLGWRPGEDLDVMVDHEASITLYDDEYNGEIRQKVRVYTPRSGPQTPENKRKTKAQTKSFLASLTAPPGADPLAGAASEDEGDEIPF